MIFENSGENIIWKKIEEDQRFAGYKVFGDTFRIFRNDFDRIQYYVANQSYLALEGKNNFLCKSSEALKTQIILEEIKSQLY